MSLLLKPFAFCTYNKITSLNLNFISQLPVKLINLTVFLLKIMITDTYSIDVLIESSTEAYTREGISKAEYG
jgi:hypothetical protein